MKVRDVMEQLAKMDPDAELCVEMIHGDDVWNEPIETFEQQGIGATSEVVALPELPIVSQVSVEDPQARLIARRRVQKERERVSRLLKGRVAEVQR